MIQARPLAKKMQKLSYALYTLGIFVLALCVFKWGTPFLVKSLGGGILGGALGSRVVTDTLELFFYFLGFSFFGLLLFIFNGLYGVFQEIIQRERATKEAGEKIYSLGQEMAEKAKTVATLMDKNQNNMKLFLTSNERTKSFWEDQRKQVRALLFHLREIQNEVAIGETLPSEEDGPRPLEEGFLGEIRESAGKLQEILFQTQLVAFNTSIEINREESAQALEEEGGDGETTLNLLGQELERLLDKSGKLADDLRGALQKEKERAGVLQEERRGEKEKWEKKEKKLDLNYQEMLKVNKELLKNLTEIFSQWDREKGLVTMASLDQWEVEHQKNLHSLMEISQDLKKLGLTQMGVTQGPFPERIGYQVMAKDWVLPPSAEGKESKDFGPDLTLT